jgi:hypothetical protein
MVRRMRARRRLVAALSTLAIAGLGASCSGGDDDGGDDDDSAAETTTVAAFCTAADRLIDGNRNVDALGSDSFPAEVQAAFDDLRAAYVRLRDAAPPAVGPDVADTVDELDAVTEALAAAGYDLGALDTEVYRSARDRYLAASGRVEAHLAERC